VAVTLRLGSDIVTRGKNRLDIPHSTDKQDLNDRAAVRWLMDQRRPGDIVITTRLGWPALWWYSRISIADAVAARESIPESPASYEMRFLSPGPECRAQPLATTSTLGRRLLVYLGFPDMPAGFDELLMQSLNEIGVVTQSPKFARLGRALVVDLKEPLLQTDVPGRVPQDRVRKRLDGCIGIKPASKWS
jgi:hypothetical protein